MNLRNPFLPEKKGYDCNDRSQEPLPATSNFSDVLPALSRSCKNVLAKLKARPLSTDDQEAVKEIEERIDTVDRTIAYCDLKLTTLGDMASGKSALINSLLGGSAIARQSCAGESTTIVPHIFQQRHELQTKDYAAKVVFHDSTQLDHLLKDLIDTYLATFNDDRDDDLFVPEDSAENLSEREEVVGILQGMFCALPGFETRSDVTNWLQSGATVAEKLSELVQRARELIVEHETRAMFETNSVQALNDQLRPYTMQSLGAQDQSSPLLWPLVRHVAVGVDSMLLQTGFKILDVPGWEDPSPLRRAHAEQAIRAADVVVVVSDIKRAVDEMKPEMKLWEHLTHALHHADKQVVLVLTHADTLKHADDLKGRETDEQLHRMIQLEEQCKKIEQDMKHISEWVAAALGDMDDARKAWELKFEELKSVLQKLDQLRMNVRNDHVLRTIRSNLLVHAGDLSDLQIFCVGNAAYQAFHSGGDRLECPAMLTAADTGVPQLRGCLLAQPAKRLLEMMRSVVNDLPDRINALEVRLPTAQRNLVYDGSQLDAARAQLSSRVAAFCTKLSDAVKTHFEVAMTAQQPRWEINASRIVAKWRSQVKDKRAHLAMVRANGRKKKYVVNERNKKRELKMLDWPQDLMFTARDPVTQNIQQLGKSIIDLFTNFCKNELEHGDGSLQEIVTTILAQGVQPCLGPGRDDVVKTSAQRITRTAIYRVHTAHRQPLKTLIEDLERKSRFMTEESFFYDDFNTVCAHVKTFLYRQSEQRYEELRKAVAVTSTWLRLSATICSTLQQYFEQLDNSLTGSLHKIYEKAASDCERIFREQKMRSTNEFAAEEVELDTKAIAEAKYLLENKVYVELAECESMDKAYWEVMSKT